jgi:hypothetical protein
LVDILLLFYLHIFPTLSSMPRQNKEAVDISFCLNLE